MIVMKILLRSLFVAMVIVSSFACNKGLYFDAGALQRDNAILTEAKTLVGKATESYSVHQSEVATLKTHINDALTAETARGKANAPTVNMWKNVQKDDSFLNQALNDWKTKDKLNTVIISEYQKQLDATIGIIPHYESFKIKQ
jgi:hypothetical protein